MKYKKLLLLSIAFINISSFCMHKDAQWQLAKLSSVKNVPADELKIIGLQEGHTASNPEKAELQAALVGVLEAVTLEFPSAESSDATVCIDMQKLASLLAVMKQIDQDEKEKVEELKWQEEQEKNERLIASLIRRYKDADKAYRELEGAMIFFTGDNEYWQSDLPRENEIRLEQLKQEAIRMRAELEKRDPACKRYDAHFLKTWLLED